MSVAGGMASVAYAARMPAPTPLAGARGAVPPAGLQAAPKVLGAAERLLRKASKSPASEPQAAALSTPITEAIDGTAAAAALAAVRSEVARLRASAGAPDYEKRELLADLGTRLRAFAGDIGGSAQATAVRELLAELVEEQLARLAGGELTALWDRVLAALDVLAAGGQAGGPAAERPGGSGRSAFWRKA
jgi:Ca-activated chloride channel family protein